jgi:hypothetical protein
MCTSIRPCIMFSKQALHYPVHHPCSSFSMSFLVVVVMSLQKLIIVYFIIYHDRKHEYLNLAQGRPCSNREKGNRRSKEDAPSILNPSTNPLSHLSFSRYRSDPSIQLNFRHLLHPLRTSQLTRPSNYN